MHQISIQYLYYNNHVKDSVRTGYIELATSIQAIKRLYEVDTKTPELKD
jgi:hypothetical protein